MQNTGGQKSHERRAVWMVERELGLSDKEMEQIVEALEDEDRERR